MSGPEERIRLDPEAWAEAEPCRRVAVKVSRDGHVSLAHPMAEPGPSPSGGTVWHVENVPPVVTALEVAELFGGTVLWTAGRYRLDFAELAPGRLVR